MGRAMVNFLRDLWGGEYMQVERNGVVMNVPIDGDLAHDTMKAAYNDAHPDTQITTAAKCSADQMSSLIDFAITWLAGYGVTVEPPKEI